MDIFVLLYNSGTDKEGIHSIELKGRTIVLMFEEKDDAERYCGLLEAQDFPQPSVEMINIDEIRDLGEDFIVGVKYVKEDEDYFRGHFPAEPVMPGVLQLETMAQAGGVLILTTVENPQDYLTFFMKIDNAKFKKKVIPGDTIIFRLNLISQIRRG